MAGRYVRHLTLWCSSLPTWLRTESWIWVLKGDEVLQLDVGPIDASPPTPPDLPLARHGAFGTVPKSGNSLEMS